MGKKSSSKKHKQQSQSDVSHEAYKNIAWSREKWIAIMLVVVSLIMLGWAAIISWGQLTKPKSLSLFLPKETIAMAEINTDFDHQQWRNFAELSEKGTQNQSSHIPKITDLITSLNTALSIDFANDVYPWLSRRVGVALLSDLRPALFLEVRNEQKALEYFQRRRLQGTEGRFEEKVYRGVTMRQYVSSSPFAIMKLGRYLVIAGDEKTAREIIDASKDKSGTLYSQYAFQRTSSALGGDNLGFFYGKPGYLKTLTNTRSLPETVSMESSLTYVLAGEGISIKALEEVVAIEHLALFNDETRKAKIFIKMPQKYQANLAEYFSPETEYFIGGINMPEVVKKFSLLSASKNVSPEAMEMALKTKLESWFQGKLSQQELEGLTRHEYAVGIDHGALKIAIQFENAEAENERLIKKLAFALPPSTYRMLGNVGIVSTSPDELTRTVNAWTSQTGETFKTSSAYRQLIEPQMQSADDVFFARPSEEFSKNTFTQGLRMLDAWPLIEQVMNRIPQMAMTSTAFEDGIKTTILIAPLSVTSDNGS